MNTRFVATAIITLALLISQGGGSALAVICPHLRSSNNTCHEMPAQQVVDHRHDFKRANGDAFDTTDSDAPCNHCAVHSRTKRDDSRLQPPNASQRASDLTIPISTFISGLSAVSKTIAWMAKAHGPPRESGPLHLLNNVFRI
jgi:hypothetical protein